MKKLFIATLFAVTAVSLFATDAPSVQSAQGFISPLAEWTLASPYGERADPLTGKRGFHSAIDMSAPLGAPVSAALDGTVSAVGYNSIYGNYIIINHGNGYQSLYGRMSKILTSEGANVGQGTQIGLVGSTGYSAAAPHLHFAVYKEGKTVDPLLLLASMPQIGAIVIDPGHGGKDPGAAVMHVIDGKKITLIEKDITLTVAKDLYALLKDKYPEKTIQLTRSDDRFASLTERADLSRTIPHADNEIVLYVSLHANSSVDEALAGFEIWAPPENIRTKQISPVNILLADSIFKGLDASIGLEVKPNVKAEELLIGMNIPGPNVLVELGFLSNPHDAQLLSDPGFINKTVQGLVNGISSFIALSEKDAAWIKGNVIGNIVNPAQI